MIKTMPNTAVPRLLQFLLVVVLLIVAFVIYSVYAQESADYQILKTIDHNPAYFTQGLELDDGFVFESGGQYGESKVRKYRPGTDETILETPIADQYFAEGLTLFNDELFLLTWQENTLFVLDSDKLQVKRKLSYDGEGWGLASNNTQLIMSNGSDTIYFRNPDTFKIENEIQVHHQQHTVRRINELEFAQDFLWANIWYSPMIVKINPATGTVVSSYDFSELVEQHSDGDDDRVLNGIAYDSNHDAYWITGKLWPKAYLVKFD